MSDHELHPVFALHLRDSGIDPDDVIEACLEQKVNEAPRLSVKLRQKIEHVHIEIVKVKP